MASSFLRNVVSAAKAKRKVTKPLTPAARPRIESLDQRVLPTVTAHLNPHGLLKVIADTHHHASQVEIVQAAGQILVEDGGRVVNSFDPTQVQQIDFKYREGHQQHAHLPLNIPVNQQQMTLTGVAVGEVDLNIGAGAMTAAVSAALADGTAVSLAGAVDAQGNYDLTGNADVSVAGFTLPGAAFELTPAGMTVSGTAAVGGASVSLAGAVDAQGNYDLTGTGSVTVAGFSVDAAFELTNGGLAVAGSVTVGADRLSLAGSVSPAGAYDLTGAATVTVAGFALDAHFELTNANLAVAATVSLGGDTVMLTGTVDPQGNYHLTGSGHVTVGGFGSNATFTLGNTNLMVSATVTIPNLGGLVFSGLVDGTAHYNLTASAPLVLAGFASVGNANLILNNNGLTVSAAMNLQAATVNLSGAIQPSGQFSLTGTGSVSLGGYDPVNGSFTLTNNGASVAASLNIVVATVAFGGAIRTDGTYALAGNASVTLGGFGPVNASFTLTNGGVLAAANVNVGLATVAFSGPISRTGTYALTGTANVGIGGFPTTVASFTLSNGGCTVAATVTLTVATVSFSGSVMPNGNFQLTGTATATFAGFSGSGTFTLNNIGPVVALSGTVSPNGQYQLTGTANVSFAGFAPTTTSFVLSNSGCALSANVNITVGTVAFTGTISPGGQYQLTASAHISLAGFGANASLTLRNSGLTAAGTLDLGVTGFRLAFNGPVNANGSFSFTAGTNINFGSVTSTLTLTLTQGGFTAHVHADDSVSKTVMSGPWSQRVSYRGSFDVNFGIATNGTYGASGTFQMTNTEGGTPNQTIHYSISTHQFIVKDSEIGFMLWGVAFNPYPDSVYNY